MADDGGWRARRHRRREREREKGRDKGRGRWGKRGVTGRTCLSMYSLKLDESRDRPMACMPLSTYWQVPVTAWCIDSTCVCVCVCACVRFCCLCKCACTAAKVVHTHMCIWIDIQHAHVHMHRQLTRPWAYVWAYV